MFENKKTGNRIKDNYLHYSRFIASWVNVVDNEFFYSGGWFDEWLRQYDLTEDEIRDIEEMAACGKFELEQDIEEFLKRKVEENKKK